MIEGVRVRQLSQIHDERGYLMEMMRPDWPEFQKVGQRYVTIAYPDIVKGWHYHKVQTGKFIVVRGTTKLVCYDNREGSKTRGQVNEFFPGRETRFYSEAMAFMTRIPNARAATFTMRPFDLFLVDGHVTSLSSGSGTKIRVPRAT